MNKLHDGQAFTRYSMLVLDDQGRFVRKGQGASRTDLVVTLPELSEYFQQKVVLPPAVTDVFVWVHGWQNDLVSANYDARRLFHAIETVQAARATHYPGLRDFKPGFLAVHWPSKSPATLRGYIQMRDRASAMTDQGYAEFFLASLLGYLDSSRGRNSVGEQGTLRSARGFAVHCVGHSFGGRFLTAAVRAAATPKSPKTLSLLREIPDTRRGLLAAGDGGDGRFAFTIDSLLVFQMAAPHKSFASQLRGLIDTAPLRGPIVLTHSKHDKANCKWHWYAEWLESGIGCCGATQPKEYLHAARLHSLDQPYTSVDIPTRGIVNVDASAAYTSSSLFDVQGAHSDYWYEESIHLLLSLANATR